MCYPRFHKNYCRFRVWAPEKETMILRLLGQEDKSSDSNWDIVMNKESGGYFIADVTGVKDGDRYVYIPDGRDPLPDPCSSFQPEGVFAASQVIDHDRFKWKDSNWRGRPLSESVFYEIHVGTFTPAGSFEAIIPRLDELKAVGVNTLELMPVAQCPGKRNWGYDGVFLYAVQEAYGGPAGLRQLVDACHQRDIAVFLDVVYNHIGPEGNCLPDFGPYFSDKYKTPWGKALNFDGEWSDGVRDFIVGNAAFWAEQYHIDGLRLDAIHEIFDRNAVTIWDELNVKVKQMQAGLGRSFHLVAESDSNDPRTIRSTDLGGKGFDAQWLDDFHHALYVSLYPEGGRNYQDYIPMEGLAKSYKDGFVHSGDYLFFRHRRHGASSAGISGEHFIVFNQNHDLPGNRPDGLRLSGLVELPALKLAAAALLLSPYIPLLFMGEEYGETAPFHFFSDYQRPETCKGLIENRRRQFAAFQFAGETRDPQDPAVFRESKLNWANRRKDRHKELLDWHTLLLKWRREHPLLADLCKDRLRVEVIGRSGLALHRWSADHRCQLTCLFNFSADTAWNPGEDYKEYKTLLASGFSGVLLDPMGIAVLELNWMG